MIAAQHPGRRAGLRRAAGLLHPARRAIAGILGVALAPALIASLAAPMQTRRGRSLLERWVPVYSRFDEVLPGFVTVKSFTMKQTRGLLPMAA